MATDAPLFSIIVPVLGEPPAVMRACEARLAPLTARGEAEVLVVDGDPAGGSLRWLTGDHCRRLTAPPGRGRQMNAGAAQARGAALLFLHADVRLPPDGLALARRALAEGADAGAFALAIDSPRRVLALIARAATWRSRLTGVPYGDQAIFVRTEVFRSLGGFRELPIMEDLDLMRRLGRAGGRVRLLSAPVLASARRWEAEGAWRCTLRNWLLVALFLLGVPAGRLAGWYPPAPGR